ncbi:hypothetical protein XENOCAPTIV_016353, partial [Xenoophorus captivus]
LLLHAASIGNTWQTSFYTAGGGRRNHCRAGGEDGQFADMSEPDGRRRLLLFHLQELRVQLDHLLRLTEPSPDGNGAACPGFSLPGHRHFLGKLAGLTRL